MQTHSDLFCKLDIIDNNLFKDVAMIREEILNRLDVLSLLEYFGIQNFSTIKGEIRCPCPIHKGMHNNFRIKYTDSFGTPTFRWNCFSHLCEKDTSSDIFGFIQSMNGCSFYESIKFLMDFVGLTVGDVSSGMSREQIKSRNELTRVCSELERLNGSNIDMTRTKNPFLNEDFVKRSLERRNMYFKNRGFSDNVLDIFEIGHCSPPDSAWNYAQCKSRAVIPIRDENLRLVGISGRAETDVKNGDSKYRILSGSDKEGNLYGLCYSRPYIVQSGNVVIVEGFADLWKCWMAGIKNVVAIMGKDITDRQLFKLVKYATNAFICFDYDKGKNEENVIETEKKLSCFMSVRHAFISEDNDLGGSSIEEVKDFFNRYKRFI
jgi:DNA primase